MDHTDVARTFDRLRREVRILSEMYDNSTDTYPINTAPLHDTVAIHNSLILRQAKKVRTASNLLVRALARERDQLQPEEGTSE